MTRSSAAKAAYVRSAASRLKRKANALPSITIIKQELCGGFSADTVTIESSEDTRTPNFSGE